MLSNERNGQINTVRSDKYPHWILKDFRAQCLNGWEQVIVTKLESNYKQVTKVIWEIASLPLYISLIQGTVKYPVSSFKAVSNSAIQSIIWRLTALAWPGSLFKMQTLRIHFKSPQSAGDWKHTQVWKVLY